MTTEGERLKLDGQTLAANAVPPWSTTARRILELLAETGEEFTSEDLTAIVGLPREAPGMNRNNAVGAVISGAARAGVIERVGYRLARRPNQHAANLAVWRGITSRHD